MFRVHLFICVPFFPQGFAILDPPTVSGDVENNCQESQQLRD